MIRLAGGFMFLVAVLMAIGFSLLFQPRSVSIEAPASQQPARDAFAQDHPAVPFDARRAMGYLDAICKIGPRITGEAGMKKQQELLQKHFEDLGGRLDWQRFSKKQNSRSKAVEVANLIVSWHPDRLRRVIFCSHYDTRPQADQEPDRRKWREPFLSANDGGSGVALLMELGHHVKDLKMAVGLDFVFFDAEEYVFKDPEAKFPEDQYFIGSEYFAQTYRKNPPKQRYVAAVLLDMVGGKNARFPVEQNSWFKAGALVQEIWHVAAELKSPAFQNEIGPLVLDDHLALNNAQIPAVDIIDFSYPHWHKLSDVPANCSGESLAEVARVLTVWVQRVK
jgi:hypothetical protein